MAETSFYKDSTTYDQLQSAETLVDEIRDAAALLAETATSKTLWAEKAALLDPRAYVYQGVSVFSQTVPAGERWWLLNGWVITPDGNPTNSAGQISPWFHRVADVDQAVPLNAGTTIANYSGDGLTIGFALYCRPKLVYDIDPRYQTDPKGLYERRMYDLRTFTQKRCFGVFDRGVPNGTQPVEDFTWSSPSVLYGFVLQTYRTNAAWTVLAGTDAAGVWAPINMSNEISDTHASRDCVRTYLPFIRKQPGAWGFTGVKIASGNTMGDFGNVDAKGSGGVHWVELPNTGW